MMSKDKGTILTERSIAKIVAAFAARSDVPISQILTLLEKLRHQAGAPTEEPVDSASRNLPPLNPTRRAISIENAVTPDKVFCLCCGRGFSMLKRHLGAEHGLTETMYREMFSLPDNFTMVAPSYSKRKADHARKIGLGKHNRGSEQVQHQKI